MKYQSASSDDPSAKLEDPPQSLEDSPEQWFSERFEALLPRIQERWPEVAKQTLEATRGSFDEVVRVISSQQSSSKSDFGVREQLQEIISAAEDCTRDLADSLGPLEEQLEELLDDLNRTLRPKIEKPIREKPFVALGIAAGVGLLLGLLLSGGRRNT